MRTWMSWALLLALAWPVGCGPSLAEVEMIGAPGWPQALRRVRAWLEPYLMLIRYWRAWSVMPPPQQLQRLLDWLFAGNPIYFYTQ